MKLNAAFWLSMVLAVAGCTGLVLAGRGKWYGWAVGLAVQPVWIAFGIVTKGYGLCLSSLLYGTVYTRNLLAWRRRTTYRIRAPCRAAVTGRRTRRQCTPTPPRWRPTAGLGIARSGPYGSGLSASRWLLLPHDQGR